MSGEFCHHTVQCRGPAQTCSPLLHICSCQLGYSRTEENTCTPTWTPHSHRYDLTDRYSLSTLSPLTLLTDTLIGLTGAEKEKAGGRWWAWRWPPHCCSSWCWLSTSTSWGRQHWMRGRREPRWFTSSQAPPLQSLLSLNSSTRLVSEPEYLQGESGQPSWKCQVRNEIGIKLCNSERNERLCRQERSKSNIIILF